VACTPEQRAIRELNLAVYCFDGAWLWLALKRIQPNPKKGEYFLTDLVEMARRDGREVLATIVEDADECIGINTRVDLADADAALRKRINKQHMLNGVSIVDPLSTYIDVGVEIGQDAIILPNTHVLGATKIGSECVIGPNSLLRNAMVGSRVEICQSAIHDSCVDDDADVGPFSHLRNGAHVAAGAHVGNFAEIKKSTLGKRSKMGHFSYLGDATVGEDANLGAGMITANYDGVNKHETRIGDNAFIGSDTILRAPVCVGDGAATGAGAIVTKDVPENSLVVGMPARVIRKRG
jgi:bifunctional UDP-N-acetylglucosamine pyrophosphorylase/glucosamine-1-phosphate N-acetyltransferase